jgi:hypothetical protein
MKLIISLPKSAKDPIAKDLRTPKYRMRVVGSKTAYTRKGKHPHKTVDFS